MEPVLASSFLGTQLKPPAALTFSDAQQQRYSPYVPRLRWSAAETPPSSPSSSHVLRRSDSPVDSSFDELARAYRVKELRFSTASHDAALPNGFKRLDTRHELFGLEPCIQLFDGALKEFDIFGAISNPMLRPRQFLYAFAPEGYGLRTLFVNLCRERRINMLYFGQPLCPSRYDPGTYAKLVQRAKALEPCVVLIDRLDNHWSHDGYPARGAELFAYWSHAEYDQQTPPARLWFVITGREPIQKQSTEFQARIGHEGFACVEFIDEENCAHILRRAYADCLLAAGVQDDRPPLLEGYESSSSIPDRQRRLEESVFQRALEEKKPYLKTVATRLFAARQRFSGDFVLPSSLHDLMHAALQLACRRSPISILPTEDDIENALSRTFQ